MNEMRTEKPFRFEACQFRLRTLFWWQVALLPLLLSSIYVSYDRSSHDHPYIQLMSWVLAPLSYVAILTLWSLRSDQEHKFPVLTNVKQGALFGVVFALLASVPPLMVLVSIGVGQLREIYVGVSRANLGGVLAQLLNNLGMLGIIFIGLGLFNGALGAAAGGIIGLSRDLLRRPRLTVDLEQRK